MITQIYLCQGTSIVNDYIDIYVIWLYVLTKLGVIIIIGAIQVPTKSKKNKEKKRSRSNFPANPLADTDLIRHDVKRSQRS